MDILVKCSTCEGEFRVESKYRGKKMPCPFCGEPILLKGVRTCAHDVFISYATEDAAVAEALCRNLECADVPCWIAPRDIAPGKRWAEEVIKAIETTQLVVLVYSRYSNESQQVLNEILATDEKRLTAAGRLIPLRIDNTQMTGSMAYFLRALQWFDALGPEIDRHLEILVQRVNTLLDENGRPRRVQYSALKKDGEEQPIKLKDGGEGDGVPLPERRCGCGAVVPELFRFCIACGKPQDNALRRCACGRDNALDYRYCIWCGVAVGHAQTRLRAVAPSTPTQAVDH